MQFNFSVYLLVIIWQSFTRDFDGILIGISSVITDLLQRLLIITPISLDSDLKIRNVSCYCCTCDSNTVDSSRSHILPHPQTISLSNIDVEFSGTVHNLGFIFDSNLSMKQHIIKTCKAAYIEIRCISSIRKYLTEDATKTLVNSCILSRLDYCNSLLAGYPQTVIKPQQVQNSAAKLIFKSRRAEHTKPLLKQLHWLPIEQRIKYKVAFLAIRSSLTLPLSTWLSSGHFFSQNYRPAMFFSSVPCCCLHPSQIAVCCPF